MDIRTSTTDAYKRVKIGMPKLDLTAAWAIVATIAAVLVLIAIVTIRHFSLQGKLGCIAGLIVLWAALVLIPYSDAW